MTLDADGEFTSTKLGMFIVVIGRMICSMERDRTYSVQENDFKVNFKRVEKMVMGYITTSMVTPIQDNG